MVVGNRLLKQNQLFSLSSLQNSPLGTKDDLAKKSQSKAEKADTHVLIHSH